MIFVPDISSTVIAKSSDWTKNWAVFVFLKTHNFITVINKSPEVFFFLYKAYYKINFRAGLQ